MRSVVGDEEFYAFDSIECEREGLKMCLSDVSSIVGEVEMAIQEAESGGPIWKSIGRSKEERATLPFVLDLLRAGGDEIKHGEALAHDVLVNRDWDS